MSRRSAKILILSLRGGRTNSQIQWERVKPAEAIS